MAKNSVFGVLAHQSARKKPLSLLGVGVSPGGVSDKRQIGIISYTIPNNVVLDVKVWRDNITLLPLVPYFIVL